MTPQPQLHPAHPVHNSLEPAHIYPKRWRRSWQWLLWLALGGGLYLLRDSERHSTLASETSQLLTQSQVAARVLELEIEAASHALDMLLRSWPNWQPATAPQAAQTLQHLEDVLRVMPGTRSFTLLDRHGVVQLSTVAGLVGGNYAHRPYFQEIVQTAPLRPGQVFISAPYQTTLNRTWAVNVSRPVLDGQGQQQGVAVATLDPAFFSELMNELRYADDMVVGLVHDSGQPYVASAHPGMSDSETLHHLGEVYTGQWVASPGASEHLHVSNTARPKVEGHIDHTFTAIAMRDTGQVLRGWHQQNRRIALLFGLAMLASAAGLVAYQRWAQRMQRAAEQAEARLRNMAFHDPLTQALNRRAFTHAMEQELQRLQRASGGAALLMLDVDHFKSINDRFGHGVGDQVLQTLVRTLQEQLRQIDLLGRLGGEEFAVLLPLTPLDGALQVAERLRTAVAGLALPVPPPSRTTQPARPTPPQRRCASPSAWA